MYKASVLFWTLLLASRVSATGPEDFALRQCEPIRIEMCRGIGYNETSMPNLVGHELQADVEFTLQTFAPLIEYVCSTQLKLFLCAAYVPLCTPKAPIPIGPCRSLCESVRSRCHPVLQGFGFPWPPALDCSRFPKENNNETMCMEGPGEVQSNVPESEFYPGATAGKVPAATLPLECPGLSKSHLYVKLHRSGRCAPLCDADILFGQHEKHLAEVWVATWAYAALGLAVIAVLCLVFGDESRNTLKWSRILTPLVWCHFMVTAGWTVRFIAGRTNTACGFDPQLPNISLLLVDGLSNAACATTFLLRYYFLMAACAWWAILCLAWHRDVRRSSPDALGHFAVEHTACTLPHEASKRARVGQSDKGGYNMTQSNLACFAAWGLPAFQTAAVIVARLVDADELLGACFVGNQSDKGLQILVATPLFCYWIFGSMNLGSGYLVHRRNNEILQNTNAATLQQQLQTKRANCGIGTFLFIYCVPCALLLLAVIYEFANIDVWLNVPGYVTATEGFTTPLWPFLMRAFMELMLGIICFAWVLGPKISLLYKRQLTPRPIKQLPASNASQRSSRNTNVSYSTASYHTVRQPRAASGISMNQMSNYSLGRNTCAPGAPAYVHASRLSYKQARHLQRRGNETIL